MSDTKGLNIKFQCQIKKNDLSAAILIAGFNEKWLFNTYNLMKEKMEYDTNLIFRITLNHTVKEVYKA